MAQGEGPRPTTRCPSFRGSCPQARPSASRICGEEEEIQGHGRLAAVLPLSLALAPVRGLVDGAPPVGCWIVVLRAAVWPPENVSRYRLLVSPSRPATSVPRMPPNVSRKRIGRSAGRCPAVEFRCSSAELRNPSSHCWGASRSGLQIPFY